MLSARKEKWGRGRNITAERVTDRRRQHARPAGDPARNQGPCPGLTRYLTTEPHRPGLTVLLQMLQIKPMNGKCASDYMSTINKSVIGGHPIQQHRLAFHWKWGRGTMLAGSVCRSDGPVKPEGATVPGKPHFQELGRRRRGEELCPRQKAAHRRAKEAAVTEIHTTGQSQEDKQTFSPGKGTPRGNQRGVGRRFLKRKQSYLRLRPALRHGEQLQLPSPAPSAGTGWVTAGQRAWSGQGGWGTHKAEVRPRMPAPSTCRPPSTRSPQP